MNLQIVSYNGVDLNNNLFAAYFPKPSVMLGPDVDIGEVERSYYAPISTYKRRKSKMLFIHIRMLGTLPSDVDTLNALFDPYDQDKHELLCRDINDNYKEYFLEGTPGHHPGWDGEELVVSVKVDDPVWRSKQEIETSWAITSDGDQETIAVGGSTYSEPVFEITPTAAKSGGKAYRIFCPVYNPSSNAYADYPLDIVNDGLDTSALVADSARTVDLNGGVNDSVTTFDYDGEVGTLPDSGIAYIESEQFSYTGKSGTQLTGITRGVNGTSAAAHADDTTIYASKMEADGGDIQVLVDGVAVDYWLQDMNNATTQVWINLDLLPARDTTLGIAIASSGSISTITLENTTVNITNLYNMPNNGLVLIGSELFSYTGKNMATRQLTGVARSVNGTSSAAHSISDDIRWIEHDIYIYHGIHTLPSFTVDDDNKPYIELDSTNNSWEWDATFSRTDTDKTWHLLTGCWRSGYPANWDNADYYDRNIGATITYGYYESMSTSSPSTQTTEADVIFSVLGQYFLDTGYIPSPIQYADYGAPGFVHIPAGFTHVAATGKRWMSSAAGTDWYTTTAELVTFQKAYATSHDQVENNSDTYDAFSVAAPGSTDTIDTWAQGSLDLSGTYNYFGFASRRDATDRDGEVRLEVDTLTVTLVSANIPVASAGVSAEYYHIDADLVNINTGEHISIDYNIALNSTLTIDTSGRTVTDNDSGTYVREAITPSTYRHDWLKLLTGANVLQWDEDDAAGLTVVIKRRERKL